ncbi:DUF1801 domain-containing protein [uncultured Polaribacter sp.]|uniref:DUF1801 domain-containing protein n=1 Tax=uncultured Polaribacter sp. TaxID=174711 RepID=UPI002609B5B2|nr:DUF1801 domain-containing protein [uncultured Polaribacter sp.]
MQEEIQSKIQQQLDNIADPQLKTDSYQLLKVMTKITGRKPKLWHNQMIGFGSYTYQYESGREGEWFLTGFCPRKKYLAVYIVDGFTHYKDIMSKLGKFKTGASCLYINTLNDIDKPLLGKLIEHSFINMKNKYSIKY